METSVVKEEGVEKQIGGCMAGFFNMFDRPHLLSPKRLSLNTEPSLESGSQSLYATPELRSPSCSEFKQVASSRRFSKEAPRLSLDSRAVVDAKGSLKPRQIRTDGCGSPSVIARLMGLEPLPAAQPLQRSASESRATTTRFLDSFNFQNPHCRGDEKSITPAQVEDPPAARAPQRCIVRPKSFFDSADIFPEPRRMSRGSHPPTNDLETLKQLLQALRLKGLLHSCSTNKPHPLFKPSFAIRSVTPSRPDHSKGRMRSTSQSTLKSPNRRPTLKESPPTLEPVKTRSRTGRGLRGTRIEADKCSTQAAVQEMWKVDQYNRQGKTLLERCDKLLHSIAEMAASETAGESQPSPVSVLDASLYYEESSPSPVMKRSLEFTESEDESWAGSTSSCSDSEYVYISDILRASDRLPQESDIFSLLEKKQQYLKGKCASAQERRLIFDLVQEILGRIRRLPPWIMVGGADKMLQLICSEFHKLRKKRTSTEEGDLVGYVCGVLGSDLSDDPWRDFPVDMSEAVLDIERLIFKDLIGETIRHMTALNRSGSLRRRLLF